MGSGYSSISREVSWLLMPWLLVTPCHQDPCYWLCKIGRSMSSMGKDLNYLCHQDQGYGWQHLTPYMIKFINYVPYFLENSRIPLCRFETEGGEHGNYEHNLFYYQHTTRHGGSHRIDPVKALLCSIFRRLCYEVEPHVVDDLKNYVKKHRSATIIQKHYRGYRVRKGAQGISSSDKSKDQGDASSLSSPTLLFQNMSFVLAGPVPKMGKKNTHKVV